MGKVRTAAKVSGLVIWIIISLVIFSLSIGLYALSLSSQVATLTASAALTAAQNRKVVAAAISKEKKKLRKQYKKDLAKAVSRSKAKGRLRRAVVAVPVLGAAAAAAFEHHDYKKWKEENPQRSLAEYACEVGVVSADVIDEVLQELPRTIRPSKSKILANLPVCELR